GTYGSSGSRRRTSVFPLQEGAGPRGESAARRGSGERRLSHQLSFRMVLICPSAHLAASAVDFLPVRMSRSICCMTVAFSTSAHFSAFGVNQEDLAAAAAASLPFCAAALSSSAVELGRTPFSIRPCIEV